MREPSFRDVEQLSAYLDRQLSPADRSRLEERIKAEPQLETLLHDLREARSALRKTPARPVPRNFTLTPKMARIRPPLPRLIPTLSWASAVASLLFFLALGSRLIGQFSFGAAAPMVSSAPMTSQGSGLGGGEAATVPPTFDNTLLNTPTPEASLLGVPQPTQSAASRLAPAPGEGTKALKEPVSPWLYIWPGLAVLLLAAAFTLRWLTVRKFRRKFKK